MHVNNVCVFAHVELIYYSCIRTYLSTSFHICNSATVPISLSYMNMCVFVLSSSKFSSVTFACAVILLLLTPGCFSLGSTVWVESSQQNSEGVREEISPATLEFLSQRLWKFLLKSQPLFS